MPAFGYDSGTSHGLRTAHSLMVAETSDGAPVHVGTVDPSLTNDAESNHTFGPVLVIVARSFCSDANVVGTSGDVLSREVASSI